MSTRAGAGQHEQPAPPARCREQARAHRHGEQGEQQRRQRARAMQRAVLAQALIGDGLQQRPGQGAMQRHGELIAELDCRGADDDLLSRYCRRVESPVEHVDIG
jgi:hypothetical protein